MTSFDIIAILVCLSAAFSYLNHRWLGMHPSNGVMLIAMLMSFLLIAINKLGINVHAPAATFLNHVNFSNALLQWMLGFLLFAGAMSVDLNELTRHRGIIVVLAMAGTIVSMFLVSALLFCVKNLLGLPLSLNECLLFGALISPTDPVAVIGMLKGRGASPTTEIVIAAEALFNDGVGVVLFLSILGVIETHQSISLSHAVLLFGRESLGAVAVGLLTGGIVFLMLRRIHNFQVEVLLTLALAMGCYALADALQTSGPIAAVVAGLLIGNHGKFFSMRADANAELIEFWELIESVLNAILFVLLGLQILITPFTMQLIFAAAIAVPIALFARWFSVLGIVALMPGQRRIGVSLLTWGGLRGGLAMAMALSLPADLHRQTLVAITYGVVVFSVLVQGTTVQKLIDRQIAK